MVKVSQIIEQISLLIVVSYFHAQVNLHKLYYHCFVPKFNHFVPTLGCSVPKFGCFVTKFCLWVPNFLHQTVCKNINLVCTFINYTEFTNAPLNVKPEGGGAGKG